jgi:hypothetical protein
MIFIAKDVSEDEIQVVVVLVKNSGGHSKGSGNKPKYTKYIKGYGAGRGQGRM